MEHRKAGSRDRRIILILAAGVALAIAAGVLAYMYLTPQKTTVYVFNDSYKSGEALTEDMLTSIQCDSSIVIAGADGSTSDMFVTGQDIKYVLGTGDSLRMDVAEGMPLTMSMLSVNGGSSIEMSMDPYKVAVTVGASQTSAVTNDLKEGSLVNVYFTGGETMGTTLVFQGMRVLSVSRDSSGAVSAVTLECTTDESLKLVYYEEYGSLYFGLVDGSGYERVDGEPSYAAETSGWDGIGD